jgi:hypothetical protein
MKRLLLLGAVLGALVPGAAFAHEGGHQGGCEDFGHFNRELGQNPGDYGFPAARNLGDIVSSFAQQGGVAGIVQYGDHLACGPQ